MIESSKKVISLTISEKVNTVQPIHVCGLDEIDMLITELPADHPMMTPYSNIGITVL
jgi:DeoR/GlpR family transcriptional regulator of sugar metabolism